MNQNPLNQLLLKSLAKLALVCLMAAPLLGHAQGKPEQRWFTYQGKDPIKLEVTAYEPKAWNGKVVVLNHGSTGDNPQAVKTTVKFVRISKALTDSGYKVFALMRKGRGASEGEFTEESSRGCTYGERMREVAEAEPQLDQFVDSLRSEHKVDKVYMMGHSRGGFLTSYYSARNPTKVAYAVNISGAWASNCEAKSGQSWTTFKDSSRKFKNQIWVYATEDRFFTNSKIDEYEDLAKREGVAFVKLVTGSGDGHAWAAANPDLWIAEFLTK